MSQEGDLSEISAFDSYSKQREIAVQTGEQFKREGVKDLKDRIEQALSSVSTREEALATVRQVLLHTTELHGQYEDPVVRVDKTEESVSIVVRVRIWNVDMDGNRYPVDFVATHLEPIDKLSTNKEQNIIHN